MKHEKQRTAPRPPPPPPPAVSHTKSEARQGLEKRPQQDYPPSTLLAYPSYAAGQSNEAYGKIATSSSTGVLHRRGGDGNAAEIGIGGGSRPSADTRTGADRSGFGFTAPGSATYAAAPSSSYKTPPSRAFAPTGVPVPVPREPDARYYLHNGASSCFLIVTLISIFWSHESSTIPQVFLYIALSLYALDLINARDALAVAVWIAALVLAMTSGFAALLQVDDSEASGGAMIFFLLRLSVEGMFFCALACWCTLQLRWLYRDARSFAASMEQCLHSLIPPVTASILTNHSTYMLMDYCGVDRAATLAPITFAFLLTAGMFTFGCTSNSYGKSPTSSIPPFTARMHSSMLLMVPGLMHILTFRNRILSRQAGADDLYDLIIVWAIPYLLHCILLALSDSSPYEMSSSHLFPRSGYATLQGAMTPMIVSMLASFALQNRYLIPICRAVSYQFNGHDLPGLWTTSLCLTLSTGCALFASWTWGRKSVVTDELLFGEYHEDVVQLSLSASGLFIGLSFGIPLSLTPLPILAFLGLSVWITTRMLRYLCLFLFVVHAAGLVLFNYRFAAIDLKIPLALPGLEVGLIRFGMVVVAASVLIGLVVGFAVRPPGGIGASLLKTVDVPGFLLIAYTCLLSILELTLLNMPLWHDQERKDTGADAVTEDDTLLYDHSISLLTGLLLGSIIFLSYRFRLVSKKAALMSFCLATSKAICVLLDSQKARGKNRTDVYNVKSSRRVFKTYLFAAMLLIVITAPRAMLTPVHIKGHSRYKRSLINGKPSASVPQSVNRMVGLYSWVVLPGMIALAVPTVLLPIVKGVSAHFSAGAYYSEVEPFSEIFGFGLSLWGASSLSFLNHYLPDGGAETMKKTSAFTLLMGILVASSAPPMPHYIGANGGLGTSNPYAAVSSLGSHLVQQGRSRTGGWGLLSSFMATLLSVTGPLELRERRHHSGRKDKQLLLRLMLFSLLFGSGASWFITMQLMGDASFVTLLFISLACMVVAFFGTVTCVLGHFLELESFDEVDQMAKVWIGGFLVSVLIASVASTLLAKMDQSVHAFGAGGWLSTYLCVTSLATLALSVVLQIRPTKNQASRGLGNLSCVVSFILGQLVVYGRYGVSGLDDSFDLTTMLGMPASIIGTFVLSSVLLGMDTAVSSQRRSRVSRLSGGGSKVPRETLGLFLGSLAPSNRIVFPILGCIVAFSTATLYTIFLRGLGNGAPTGPVDLFSSMIGKGSESLSAMAGKTINNSRALVVAARLAGCGIWTANSVFGPIVHLLGLAAVTPSVYFLLSFLWFGVSAPTSQSLMSLPLNAFPLLLCKGTPSLRATALIGLCGGLYQLVHVQRHDHRSRMRI